MRQLLQISQRFYNLKQSWHYERIVRVVDGVARLRVCICRNAYDDQSHVRGYVLDPVRLQWNLLVDRPIKGASCEDASYTSPHTFNRDTISVLNELLAIIP